MLKQEELAFVKAISTMEFSPALLRELRKAMAARNRSGAGAPSKVKQPCETVSKRRFTNFVAGSTVQPSNKPLKNSAAKRKPEEHSS
jgi:hypothetical protein